MNLKVDFSKILFFDRPIVKKMAGTAAAVLSKFGAFVRRTGRQQIRQAPRKRPTELTEEERDAYAARMRAWAAGRIAERPRPPRRSAPAGKPPFAHRPRSPIKLILSVFDPRDASVSIGPVAWGPRPGEATEALEYGGKSRTGRGTIRVPPHPNMTPAFQKNLPHLRNWRRAA